MKNLTFKKWAMLLSLSTFVLFSCSDDGGDDKPTTTSSPSTPASTANRYSGSASYGDLITFQLDKQNSRFSIFNETTNQSESGTFTTRTDSLFSGVYQVIAAGDTFFGIELDDKIAVANFPSGNNQNDIVFGVSSEIDNTGKINQMVGDYVYVRLGNYLKTDKMEWGVFTLGQDSLWGVVVDEGNNDPGDTTINRPLNYSNNDFTNRSFDGKWTVTNDRIAIEYEGIDGMSSNITGYAYAAGTTSVFLMDFGTGKGSAIAYKIDDNSSVSNISAVYKYISFDQEGDKGAGHLTIYTDGTVDVTFTDGAADNTYSASLNGSLTSTNIPNVYYMGNFDNDGNELYLVAAGEALMFYIFDANGNFKEYGAGSEM